MRLRRSQDHRAVASGFLISWAMNPRYFPRRPGGISEERKPTLACSQAPSYRLDRLLSLKEIPDPVPPARSPIEASPFLPRELAQSVGTGIALAPRNPVASKATWEEPNAAVYRAVERRLARDVPGGDQPISASYRRRGTAPCSPLR